jgi:hypothetical protein
MSRNYVKAIHDRLTHLTHAHLWFRKNNFGSKVFCIGYNKTGTTSLGKAFKMLGYRHTSFNKKVWRDFYRNGKVDKIIHYTAKFEAMDDLPWLLEDMIPVMDNAFPGSKFIYLQRDEASWKESYKRWRKKVFDEKPDLEIELEKYRAHRSFVLDYFKDRPAEDFLVMDIKEKNGFKKLANFLGKETDQSDFPHQNKTSDLQHRKKK